MVASEGESAWEPASGQFLFELAEAVPLGAVPDATEPSSEELDDADRSPDEWFELGSDMESRSIGEAREAYARAIRLDPDHAGANINLGRLLHEAGDLDGAEGHYRAALAAQPENATAAFNLGVVLEDSGDVEAAIESYLDAVEIDPGFADAHYNVSNLFERGGERESALRHLRAYSLLPKSD
jgi:tetratricopeptide (TPR) repeat protein